MDHWTNFYRSGRLATGPAGPDGRYDLEVAQAWNSLFALLPAEAVLLDVATGNGVLAVMASQWAREHGCRWTVHATDAALINPVRDVRATPEVWEGIQFHPGVATERLPFPEQSVDAVVAHYGIEYGDLPASLAAIRRVLKPGGVAQFVIHHAGSELILSAAAGREDAELVLQGVHLYRALRRLVEMGSARDQSLQMASRDVVSALQTLKERLRWRRMHDPNAGMFLAVAIDAAKKLLELRREMPGARVAVEVDRADRDLRLARNRLLDLEQHAMDRERFATFGELSNTLGFVSERAEELYHNQNHLVGWLLRLRNPA